jgi:hypothetical protein
MNPRLKKAAMSFSERPSYQQFEAEIDALSDRELWRWTLLCVGLAGKRAHKVQRYDINAACKEYCDRMAELADMPRVYPKKGNYD